MAIGHIIVFASIAIGRLVNSIVYEHGGDKSHLYVILILSVILHNRVFASIVIVLLLFTNY